MRSFILGPVRVEILSHTRVMGEDFPRPAPGYIAEAFQIGVYNSITGEEVDLGEGHGHYLTEVWIGREVIDVYSDTGSLIGTKRGADFRTRFWPEVRRRIAKHLAGKEVGGLKNVTNEVLEDPRRSIMVAALRAAEAPNDLNVLTLTGAIQSLTGSMPQRGTMIPVGTTLNIDCTADYDVTGAGGASSGTATTISVGDGAGGSPDRSGIFVFSLSSIPDTADITDVDLQINVTADDAETNDLIQIRCYHTVQGTDPSGDSAATRWTRSNNGTQYTTYDANGTGSRTFDLGTTADSDVEGELADTDRCTIALYSDASMDASEESTIEALENAGTDPATLVVSYNRRVSLAGSLPSMMGHVGPTDFPTVVTQKDTLTATGTSHDIAMPPHVTAGWLLIACLSGVVNPNATPSGWTSLSARCFAKIASGSEGGTTVNFTTDSNTPYAARVYAIDNWYGDLTDGVAITASATGSSANPDPDSLNPANWDVENTLWMAIVHHTDTVNTVTLSSVSSGYLEGSMNGPAGPEAGTYVYISTALRRTRASSEDPGTFTLSESGQWRGYTIAVRGVQGNVPIDGDLPAMSSVIAANRVAEVGTAVGVSGTGDQSFSYTVPSGYRNLCLIVTIQTKGGVPTSVTYDGVAMTATAELSNGNSCASVYRLIAPPEGAHTVAVDTPVGATGIHVLATTFANVDQQVPTRSIVTRDNSTATESTVTLTNVHPRDLIVDSLFGNDDNTGTDPTIGANQTLLYGPDSTPDNTRGMTSIKRGPSTGPTGSVDMSWTTLKSGLWIHVAYAVAAYHYITETGNFGFRSQSSFSPSNTGFETNTTGYTAQGSNTVAVSAEQAYAGAQSMKCTYQNNLTFFVTSNTFGTQESWRRVRCQIYIPADYDGGQIELQSSNYSDAEGDIDDQADMTKRDMWQEMNYRVNIKSDSSSTVELFMHSAPSVGKFVYIDEFYTYTESDGQVTSTNRVNGDLPAMSGGIGFRAFIDLSGNLPAQTGTAEGELVIVQVPLDGSLPAQSGDVAAVELVSLAGNLPSQSGVITFRAFLDLAGSLPSQSGEIDSVYLIALLGNLPAQTGIISLMRAFIDLLGDLPQQTGTIDSGSGIFLSGSLPSQSGIISFRAYLDLSGDLPFQTGEISASVGQDLSGDLPFQTGSLLVRAYIDLTGNLPSQSGILSLRAFLDLSGSLPSQSGVVTEIMGIFLLGDLPAQTGTIRLKAYIDLSGDLPAQSGVLSLSADIDLTGSLPSQSGTLIIVVGEVFFHPDVGLVFTRTAPIAGEIRSVSPISGNVTLSKPPSGYVRS